jgi:hypothetical protein
MRARRVQLLHAADLLAHAFERGGKHLFALQGMLGCARKASASRRSLSARRKAILACQGTLLIAHIAQTLAQRLEVIEPGVIDFGMVTAQDDLMLVVAETAALEFTGYGHGEFLIAVR